MKGPGSIPLVSEGGPTARGPEQYELGCRSGGWVYHTHTGLTLLLRTVVRSARCKVWLEVRAAKAVGAATAAKAVCAAMGASAAVVTGVGVLAAEAALTDHAGEDEHREEVIMHEVPIQPKLVNYSLYSYSWK